MLFKLLLLNYKPRNNYNHLYITYNFYLLILYLNISMYRNNLSSISFQIINSIYFHRCVHEYMDVYTEIRSDNATKLIETPFGGRYCGPISPRRRVSLYRGIALSFYTDKNITRSSLFSGHYIFINACKYNMHF